MKKDIKQVVYDFYNKHRSECFNKMLEEIKKHTDENAAVNRVICIIREQNRKYNKEAVDKNFPVIKDSFCKMMKKELSSYSDDDIDKCFKQAIKYL